jgi:hypothetical protein
MRVLTFAFLLCFAPLAARADDPLNPPHPALAGIQAKLDHCKDIQPGNINEYSAPWLPIRLSMQF